jgi:hypothetical protein
VTMAAVAKKPSQAAVPHFAGGGGGGGGGGGLSYTVFNATPALPTQLQTNYNFSGRGSYTGNGLTLNWVRGVSSAQSYAATFGAAGAGLGCAAGAVTTIQFGGVGCAATAATGAMLGAATGSVTGLLLGLFNSDAADYFGGADQIYNPHSP